MHKCVLIYGKQEEARDALSRKYEERMKERGREVNERKEGSKR